jgi:hypothetical protein
MAPVGIGGTIILIVLSLVFGRDFVGGSGVDTGGPQTTANGEVAPVSQSPAEAREVQFVSFVIELRDRFGAPGDFAQAYVITHELGHHVQHLLGTDAKVRAAQEQNPRDANALSVALELQADCYSGVWANHSQQILDPGDIDEGLNAAAAVGDDRIQKAETGHVNTDTFTHGSAAQRSSWFKRGYSSGNVKDCDTFSNL